MSKIVLRLSFYDYQEGLGWIWQELEDLISYLPHLTQVVAWISINFIPSFEQLNDQCALGLALATIPRLLLAYLLTYYGI